MSRSDEVEVFVTFTGTWVGGYEITGERTADDAAYVRRRHDGAVLPTPIPVDRLRLAHAAPRTT